VQSNLVYTGLFDIGREQIDGRKFEEYQKWLVKTISIFPGIYVFHDGNLDDLSRLNCNLIKIKFSDLKIFSKYQLVANLLKTFMPESPSDITFKTPLYSLVQYSKFELANQLRAVTKFDSVLWVDAGISRFINSIDNNLLDSNLNKLISKGKVAAFEIDLRRNLDFKSMSIKNAKVGTCRRVISGTSFWMHDSIIDKMNDLIYAKFDEWFNLGVWDNEQVLIRILLGENDLNVEYVLQNKNMTGSVARKLGSSNVSKFDISSKIITLMLK